MSRWSTAASLRNVYLGWLMEYQENMRAPIVIVTPDSDSSDLSMMDRELESILKLSQHSLQFLILFFEVTYLPDARVSPDYSLIINMDVDQPVGGGESRNPEPSPLEHHESCPGKDPPLKEYLLPVPHAS